MLILTRRLGESITIGDNVKLTVLSIKGGQVRIGVEAARDVSVQRSELLEKKEDPGAKPAAGDGENGGGTP